MMMFVCRQLGGQNIPDGWGGIHRLGDETDVVTVEVNNVLAERKISNVFGVIKGVVDAGLAPPTDSGSDGAGLVTPSLLACHRSICGHRCPEGRLGSRLRHGDGGHRRAPGAGPLHLRDDER